MPPSGGRETPIAFGLADRVARRGPLTHDAARTNDGVWFGPGVPMGPVAPRSVAGRAFDYQTGYNLTYRPRPNEAVSFDTLRGLSDFDLVRLCIETRKDQMAKLRWSVQYRKPFGKQIRPKADEACRDAELWFRSPDKEHGWSGWLRMLLEDKFVIDAATIYMRPDQGKGIYAAEVIDGSTISRIINQDGRTPGPGEPAYRQILKGVPATEYTRDEMIYAVSNPRPHKLYGQSVVEQIITYVNLSIRRTTSQLYFYTEGNIPEAIIPTPPDWTPEMISQFQNYWDTLLEGNLAARRHAKFVPGGIGFQFTRSENALIDQFDEWLARIICYAFSLPPLPFVRMMNRATAESDYSRSIEEGLQPLMEWVKDLMDNLLTRVCGRSDIEFVWDDHRTLDPTEQDQRDQLHVRMGVKSLDDWRISLGLDPLGFGPAIWGVGPMGVTFIDDILAAKAAGQSSLPMPGPMDDPSMMGMDPMADIPPEALDAAGVQDAMDGDDPDALEALRVTAEKARRAKVHPKVLEVLREAERRINGPDYP